MLVSDVKKPFKLEGIYRIDDTPVHVAIREALANCLVNTDYFLPWNVVVEKYPDKIVLANPGTVRLGKKQMLRGGISQPRNRLLLNMFNFIGVGERAGSGVPDIYSIWKSEHFDDPIVDEASGREGNPDRTTLTLPMIENKRKKQAEKKAEIKGEKKGGNKSGKKGGNKGGNISKKSEEIKKRIEDVYTEIVKDPYIKVPGLVTLVGATTKQIEDALKALQADGRIKREGKTKGAHWIIL